MAAKHGNAPGTTEHSDLLWGTIAGVALLWILIVFKPEWFVWPWQMQKIAETYLLSFVPLPGTYGRDMDVILQFLLTIPADEVTGQQFTRIQVHVWDVTRYPYAALLLGLGVYITLRKKYATKHSKESLIRQESQNWPWIMRARYLNPSKEPIDSGDNAVRMKPHQLAIKKGMLYQGTFRNQRAHEIFAEQLGAPLREPENLDPALQRIMAVCLLRLTRDNDGAEDLAGDLAKAGALMEKTQSPSVWKEVDHRCRDIVSEAFSPNKPNNPNSEALADKHSTAKTIASRHGYQITLVLALLKEARRGGTLPPNWFLWLKRENRAYWYAVADEGMAVSSAESAGIRSHQLFEAELGAAQMRPQVDSAVASMKEYLDKAGLIKSQV